MNFSCFCKTKGEDKVAKILSVKLVEEKQTDETPSKFSCNSINFKAAAKNMGKENENINK
ncbi:MAG: hypothetical protein I4O51_03965 [Flavobacterium micromati]|jgi:ferritin-like metal-binding protein YciE|nr:hypothetical protein [Flavobacterium micromati]